MYFTFYIVQSNFVCGSTAGESCGVIEPMEWFSPMLTRRTSLRSTFSLTCWFSGKRRTGSNSLPNGPLR
jgi:hypothetical protein